MYVCEHFFIYILDYLKILCLIITGNAAKEGMLPYFQQILERLRMYLTTQQTEDTMCLQVQAIGGNSLTYVFIVVVHFILLLVFLISIPLSVYRYTWCFGKNYWRR